ncbi:MAG: DUF2304 domain-containing protein [Chloroflexi bacterium]|nr:DUF2304 domain-containing protein [Chloroflexota bacterium]
MADRLTLFIVFGSVVLLALVVELVRRRRLEEQYSLLWLFAAAALVALALSRSLWDKLALSVGIAYPPTALFIAGFVGMLMILLQFSVVISRLTRQNREAAQQIGLLQWKLNELEERLKRQSPDA